MPLKLGTKAEVSLWHSCVHRLGIHGFMKEDLKEYKRLVNHWLAEYLLPNKSYELCVKFKPGMIDPEKRIDLEKKEVERYFKKWNVKDCEKIRPTQNKGLMREPGEEG